VFANGGDRNSTNVPEQEIFANDPNLSFVFGVGGDWKKNSSRWILNEWKHPQTDRPWGNFRLLYERGIENGQPVASPQLKLKELTVMPGKSLSMQRHEKRKEFWFVAEGTATVYTLNTTTTDNELVGVFNQHDHIWVGLGEWHCLCNETEIPLQLIEIQYGEECAEEDIERKL
jgi:mannose-6-phosphate isomerase-like protein (cupin superfamily)